jgi:hypothetical protein
MPCMDIEIVKKMTIRIQKKIELGEELTEDEKEFMRNHPLVMA